MNKLKQQMSGTSLQRNNILFDSDKRGSMRHGNCNLQMG